MKRILFISLIVFAGCFAFKSDREYLAGEWTDFIPKDGTIYFAGNKLTFKFRNDSFFYNVYKWTDVVTKDSCNLYSDERFAAGKYSVKDDILYLTGYWTNSQFDTNKMSPCVESGPFELVYFIEIVSDDTAELNLKSPMPYMYDWRYRDKMTLVKMKNYK